MILRRALYQLATVIFPLLAAPALARPDQTVTKPLPDPIPYTVTERGPNHKVWTRTSSTIDPHTGRARPIVESYTEIQTAGSLLVNGQYVDSNPEIEITATGAQANNAAHRVAFSGNINSLAAITLSLSDGAQLLSTPISLNYWDSASGQWAQISVIQDSYGQLLPSKTEALYPDAFAGPVLADLLFVNSVSGFEQLVVLRSQLPSPAQWNLSPETTYLCVTTEFTGSTPPRVSQRQIGDLTDQHLDFGTIQMQAGRGFAFALGSEENRIRVTKQWLVQDGRSFLIERVKLTDLPSLQDLPPARQEHAALPKGAPNLATQTAAAPSPISGPLAKHRREGATLGSALAKRLFPAPRRAAKNPPSFALAAYPKAKGFAIDYEALASQTNLTLQGDTTYYLSGTVTVTSNLVVEGGCCVKIAKSASATIIASNLISKTDPYHPAVFSAKDDDSLPDPISGSTGSPSGYYGKIALDLSAAASPVLSNFRFCYLSNALAASGATLSDSQFVSCKTGFAAGPSHPTLYNVLIWQVDTFVASQSPAGETIKALNVTAHYVTNFVADTTATNYYTNCLFVCATNWQGQSALTNASAFLNSDAGIFQTAGAGAHYLADASLYRSAGTAAIETNLLARLRKTTTAPPLIYSNTAIMAQTTFAPQAQRDTGALPSLGWHYDPLDYLFGGVEGSNNLTFAAGAACGWFRTTEGWFHAGHGIHAADYTTVTFSGTAEAPCYWVRRNTVQEGIPGQWEGHYGPGGISGWTWSDFDPTPVVSLRFTKCFALSSDTPFFRDDNGYLIIRASHSDFHSGGFAGYNFQAACTNCLFERVSTWTGWEGDGGSSTNCSFSLQNCLLRGNILNLNRWVSDDNGNYCAWFIHDTAFEDVAISFSDAASGDPSITSFDYNAYLAGASTTDPAGANDQTVTNFNWQASFLGNYCLPTNSPLINTGSVASAASVGLYHFTTQTNQAIEGTTKLDIGLHYVAVDPATGKTLDYDSDGIPDYLEDANGNGLVDSGETDWTDYYNGNLPLLTIVSGNNQTGMPSAYLVLPLVVAVSATNTIPMTNAPITFSVTSGGAQISATTNGPYTNSVTLRTADLGQASVWALLPTNPATTVSITATAWSSTNSTAATFTAHTMDGLLVWLRADAGVTADGSGNISQWADQTPNHYNATASGNNRPIFAGSSGPGGKPAIGFYVTNQFGLPNILTGTTGVQAFVVLKVAATNPPTTRALWSIGGASDGADHVAYPTNGLVTDDFAHSVVQSLGAPAQPLDQFHVYEVSSAQGAWSAWINGVLQVTTSVGNYGDYRGTYLIGSSGSRSFDGLISEIVIFSRNLTQQERTAVSEYLNSKYALVPAVPAQPTNLVASAVSPRQIALSWNQVLNQGATRVSIERKLGSAGAYAEVAQVTNTTSYFDNGLAPGTTYYYQVRAINLTAWSAYSSEAQATTLTNGLDLPIGDLVLWLRSDAGLAEIGTNAPVNLWADQSGWNNHATQLLSFPEKRPVWIPAAVGGRPAVRFDGSAQYSTLPRLLDWLPSSEAFVVLRVASSTPAQPKALWAIANSSDAGANVAYPDNGYVTDDFASQGSVYGLGQPAQNLTNFHVYEVSSTSPTWRAWINGLMLADYSINKFGGANPSDSYLLGYSGHRYFAGDIAEILIFSHTLAAEERQATLGYFFAKYGLSSYATNTTAPSAPSGMVATALSPSALSLTWNPGSTNEIGFKIERRLGTNGGYQEIGVVASAITNFTDPWVDPASQYYYRVKAFNLFGESGYSAALSPPTVTVSNPPNFTIETVGTTNSLTATALDPGATVTNYVFYVESVFFGMRSSAPFATNWIASSPGPWFVTAKATDDHGNSRFSPPLRISVFPDTDGDGLGDQIEVSTGTDPTNAGDPPAPPPDNHTPPVITLRLPIGATLLP
jgi:hypothetical protein